MTTGRRLRIPSRCISIDEGALALAARHARENLPREIGGILIGWREERTVVVHDLLLIADESSAGNQYDRRHQPADILLRKYLTHAKDARLGYVGEWHSHPAPHPPSATDLRVIRAIARDLHSPVALIVLMAHRDGYGIEPAGRIAEQGAANQTRLHTAHITTY